MLLPVDGPVMLRDQLWPLAEWLGRDMFDRTRVEGAVLDAGGCEELLEVSSGRGDSQSSLAAVNTDLDKISVIVN